MLLTFSRYITCTVFVCITVLIMKSTMASGGYKREFGHALRQEVTSATSKDPEFKDVLEFVQQYAQKRFPWSVPRSLTSQGTKPEIISLRKVILIYGPDDQEPLYYDNVVRDRTGRQHGVTSFFTIGTVYRFILQWTDDKLIFKHNFTVTLYPNPSDINVYSHSCFVLSTNETNTLAKKYLFPKYDNWKVLERVSELQQGDLYYHVDESDFKMTGSASRTGSASHVMDFDQSDSCSDESCKFSDEKTVELKYAKVLSEQFSVMSYNIWNVNPSSSKMYEKRMAHFIKTIQQADPGVIALQEVRYEESRGGSLGPSQIHMLAEGLPQYQYVYEPAQMQGNVLMDGKAEEGVAIMSKYPIISHDHILLYINRSDSGDMHQRVLLHSQVYIPLIGKVHILTTHLSLSHKAREKCVVQIWQYAKNLEGPVILLGDLNAEEHEPAMQYLLGKDVFPGEERSQFIDTWLQHHPPEVSGNTFSALEKNATIRIDYILYKTGTTCCKLEKCEVLDDGSRGSEAASDHLPVMATFAYEDHIQTR